MKKVIWTACYRSTPTVVRYCKHCGIKTLFASSGRFRVNAQQKALDVWLIFKCTVCDTTWNLTVLSGVTPHSLSPALLDRFHMNDYKLAMQLSTDTALIKRNGAEPGMPEIEIIGEEIGIEEPAYIELTAQWPSELKTAAVLRSKLGLSRAQFVRLCDSGKIVCVSGQNLRKCKLFGTIALEIR